MLYSFRTQDHGWVQRMSMDGTNVVLGSNIMIFELANVEAEDFAEECARKLGEKVTINEVNLAKGKTFDCNILFSSLKFYYKDVMFVKIDAGCAVALETKNDIKVGDFIGFWCDDEVKKYD